MKRQVAITGPTPEFVRWSVRKSCELRQGTDIDSIDQTEKRLRAVRTAGQALGNGTIVDGIAIRAFDGVNKGFRVDEVFAVWGGCDRVQDCCAKCPANVLNDPIDHGTIAGCHGWLPRLDGKSDWAIEIENQSGAQSKQLFPPNELFLSTRPVWYGLWSAGLLQSRQLELVATLVRRIVDESVTSHAELGGFCKVLETCVRENLILDVELVSAGFSDGLTWTIAAHCDRCKAPRLEGQKRCGSCGKSGKGHPLIRKKVLGLRPYVDLSVVVGAENVSGLLERAQQAKEK